MPIRPVLLLGLSILTTPVLALAAEGPGAPPAALTTAALYSHRLLLGAGGVPQVAVGLAKGLAAVGLQASGGLRIIGQATGGDRWTSVIWNGRVRASRRTGRAAKLRHGVVVATLEGAERSQRQEILARWRALGERPAGLDVGLVFGLRGPVVDSRATLVLARTSASRARADLDAREINERTGVETRVVSTVEGLPEVVVALEGESGQVLLRGPVTIQSVRDGAAIVVEGVASGQRQRRGPPGYLGRIALAPDDEGQIAVVNVTAVDDLLRGVVPAEIFATGSLEALKAQAVTARGAVFAKLGRRHLADPFTLCNIEHCQMYAGTQAHHPSTDEAVAATRGELAFLAGQLVDSVYSSTCGGHTENSEVVWDAPPKAALRGRRDRAGATVNLARRVIPFEHGGLGDPSRETLVSELSDEGALRRFLAEPPDSYCARASLVRPDKLRWQKRIAQREMDRLMFPFGVGHVTAIAILGRGVSGRVMGVRVVGDRGEAVIQREWPVRKAFGNLNSGAFVLDLETGSDGAIEAFVFGGAGWGHGVGMCQVGAIGMAEAGHDYREILRHYYNGAEVLQTY